MKPPEVLAWLYDVRAACEAISRFVEGKTYEDYLGDDMLRSAVERQFEIIGEALNQAAKADAGLGQSISDLRRIISFRNRLIHGYATVAHDVVWGAVESYLPTLLLQVTAILDQEA